MTTLIEAAVSFPTAVFTVVLGVLVIYWLLAILGLVDIEAGSIDADLPEAGGDGLGALAGYAVALGLNGVPLSIVLSLMALTGWTLSCAAGLWLLPLVPAGLLQGVAGAAVLGGSLLLSTLPTALLARPLRRLFVNHHAPTHASLIGMACKVVTTRVDDRFGQAEVERSGAPFHVKVRSSQPNAFTLGSAARIVSYDAATDSYRIETEP